MNTKTGDAKLVLNSFSDLTGCVLADAIQSDGEVIFILPNGQKFHLYHEQDCCESVHIESIVGELADLVGSPITLAEESFSSDPQDPVVIAARITARLTNADFASDTSETWTFYKLATIKGYVDIRFYGTSNGYYSETASFREITQ